MLTQITVTFENGSSTTFTTPPDNVKNELKKIKSQSQLLHITERGQYFRYVFTANQTWFELTGHGEYIAARTLKKALSRLRKKFSYMHFFTDDHSVQLICFCSSSLGTERLFRHDLEKF